MCTSGMWGKYNRLGHRGRKMTHGGRLIKISHFLGRKYTASGSHWEQMKHMGGGGASGVHKGGGRSEADKCFQQGRYSREHWGKSKYSWVSLGEHEGFCARWQMQTLLGKRGYKWSLEEYVENGNANYKAKGSWHRLCIGDGCVTGTPFQLSVSSPQKERWKI